MLVRAFAPALCIALLLLPAPAARAGQSGSRQVVNLSLTTEQPAAPTGNAFHATWQNPQDPEGKPYAMRRIVWQMPDGFAYDTGALEQCHASDLELTLAGAAACPAGSVLSRGTVVTDTGSGSPLPRHMTLSLTMFNSDDEFLSLAELIDPAFRPTFRTVAHNRIRGTTVTSEFPSFPTGAPPDGYMAFQRMEVAGEPKVSGERAYARTPPDCPADGRWTIRMRFVYQDGVEQLVEPQVPCAPRRARSAAPLIRIGGVPRGRCARRPFTASVRISRVAALERAVLLLDGRRIHATARSSFRRRIGDRRMSRGRHRLTVVARASSGTAARRTARFRWCA